MSVENASESLFMCYMNFHTFISFPFFPVLLSRPFYLFLLSSFSLIPSSLPFTNVYVNIAQTCRYRIITTNDNDRVTHHVTSTFSMMPVTSMISRKHTKFCNIRFENICMNYLTMCRNIWTICAICKTNTVTTSSVTANKGRAVALAVSHWLPTAAARVRARSGHVGFVVDKVALGQVFSEYFGFLCQSSLHQILHPHNQLGQMQ
jgi:hypothetical protein